MKPSAGQGTLLMCLLLVFQISRAEVSFTFYYYYYDSNLYSFIISFSECWLERFRDCLCSEWSKGCYVYFSSQQGYYEVYNTSTQTTENSDAFLSKFSCMITFTINNSRGDINCTRLLAESENLNKSFYFTYGANKCHFMCAGINFLDYYNISIAENSIIKYEDSPATCLPIFTTVITKKTLITQQSTTKYKLLTTASTSKPALLTSVSYSTKLSEYNYTFNYTSRFGNTRNTQETTTDIGLITGVIISSVIVIIVALVIIFLWRRQKSKLNHARSTEENIYSSTNVTFSDTNTLTSSENNRGTFTESNQKKQRQSAENNSTTTSECVVEYSTVKNKSERSPNFVVTSTKQDINLCPQMNEIDSLPSDASTEVVLATQYYYENIDFTSMPSATRKTNFHITSQTISESPYTNIQKPPENQIKSNSMKDMYSNTYDQPPNITNRISDSEASDTYANTLTKTTADVYAKLGDQNKELTNPYDTLDKGD